MSAGGVSSVVAEVQVLGACEEEGDEAVPNASSSEDESLVRRSVRYCSTSSAVSVQRSEVEVGSAAALCRCTDADELLGSFSRN